ncbi:MAG: 2OG-Fe(II) oxygenase family protein [Gammaproteobacteria bacterium]|nr:2OG-Fe(II) oxygenase family protein [Gammaproteobacteria bacterium]
MNVPVIDVSDISAEAPGACDEDLATAAGTVGFLVLTGVPGWSAAGLASELTAVFGLADEHRSRLLKSNFNPDNPNHYRGLYRPSPGAGSKDRPEGYDIGRDVCHGPLREFSDDVLYEPTPLPHPGLLPGFRTAAAGWFEAMERFGSTLLAALSRGLGFPEHCFSVRSEHSVSTLRLLHYPPFDFAAREAEDPEQLVTHEGEGHLLTIGEHVDSGLMTLLSQCDQPGLQVKIAEGEWADVPVIAGSVVVNFGGLLERWTGGRIKATPHRVVSRGEERFSIPFFFEPEAYRVIEPLPGVEPFEPFQYGDYLWSKATKFPPNIGLEHLRPNRAAFTDPLDN